MEVKDIKNFFQGYAKYANRDNLPPHQQEQVQLRMFLCAPCLQNGSCTECGCKTPQMFYSPHKQDSKGHFSDFLSSQQWDSLKNNYELYHEFFRQLAASKLDGSDAGLLEDKPTTTDPL